MKKKENILTNRIKCNINNLFTVKFVNFIIVTIYAEILLFREKNCDYFY